MEIFIYELKRKLPMKRFLGYVLLAVVMGILWAWFIVGGASEICIVPGAYKGYKGLDAINKAAEDRKNTEGQMTEERFQRGGEVLRDSIGEDGEIIHGEELLEYGVYGEMLVMQDYYIKKFQGKRSTEYFENGAEKRFYENEEFYYREKIAKVGGNKEQRDMMLRIWEQVEKPYTYYSGFCQWDEGIDHMMLISLVLMIAACVFASGVTAGDRQCGIDEIIKSTVNGRKLSWGKVLIPVIMGLLIYLAGMVTFMGLLGIFLPYNSLYTSVQVFSRSIFPYSLKDVLWRIFIVGGIGTICATSFAGVVSCRCRKTSRARGLSITVVIVGFIYNMFVGKNSIAAEILGGIIPGGVGFLYRQYLGIEYMPVREVLGVDIWLPSGMVLTSIAMIVIFNIYVFMWYRRRSL